MKEMGYDGRKQLKSFGYAWKGIRTCLGEQNFTTHLLAMCLVVAGGIFFSVSPMEWVALTLCCGMVIAAELFNSALEHLTDLVSPEWNKLAGQAKDIAAGAVLVIATTAAIVGLIIFLPHILGWR